MSDMGYNMIIWFSFLTVFGFSILNSRSSYQICVIWDIHCKCDDTFICNDALREYLITPDGQFETYLTAATKLDTSNHKPLGCRPKFVFPSNAYEER